MSWLERALQQRQANLNEQARRQAASSAENAARARETILSDNAQIAYNKRDTLAIANELGIIDGLHTLSRYIPRSDHPRIITPNDLSDQVIKYFKNINDSFSVGNGGYAGIDCGEDLSKIIIFVWGDYVIKSSRDVATGIPEGNPRPRGGFGLAEVKSIWVSTYRDELMRPHVKIGDSDVNTREGVEKALLRAFENPSHRFESHANNDCNG